MAVFKADPFNNETITFKSTTELYALVNKYMTDQNYYMEKLSSAAISHADEKMSVMDFHRWHAEFDAKCFSEMPILKMGTPAQPMRFSSALTAVTK